MGVVCEGVPPSCRDLGLWVRPGGGARGRGAGGGGCSAARGLGAASRAQAETPSGWGLAGEAPDGKKKKQTPPFSSRASEGKTVEVPYKGDVENTILDILGGLRSTCTYVGAAKLKELSRRATFIRVTQQHNTVFS